MEPRAESPLPLSVVLDTALTSERPVTIGELFDRVEERGFGLLMIVVGFIAFVPIIPLGSPLVGGIYMFQALQLLVGLERPWLPGWVRRRPLSVRAVEGLRRQVPLVQRMERVSRPRFHILSNPVFVRVASAIVFVMGVVLLSPAPFLNVLPALSVMLIGFGLLNDDGLFVLIGMVLGLGLLGVFVATVHLLVQALQWLLDLARRAF